MTTLKDLCVSLETAKALVEARIKVESICVYGKSKYFEGIQYELFGLYRKSPNFFSPDKIVDDYGNSHEAYNIIPAPTFEELDPVEMIFKDGKKYKLSIRSIRKSVNHWVVSYNSIDDWNDTLTDPEYNFTNEHSLVETMAEVMIQVEKGRCDSRRHEIEEEEKLAKLGNGDQNANN